MHERKVLVAKKLELEKLLSKMTDSSSSIAKLVWCLASSVYIPVTVQFAPRPWHRPQMALFNELLFEV